ncbi:Abi family protein [Helcococcus kunzii]|nr:Abi family protein [Helcococcus kunzii]
MELKEPLNFDKQINRLKEHKLRIDDPDYAKSILKEINYYRFTGYALEFRKNKCDSNFIDNTNFNMIYDIYRFDEDLRLLLLEYLLKIEIYYRTQISYGFSLNKCKNSPHDQHYDINNYYNKTSIKKIWSSIEREIGYNKDSDVVKHHNTNYGKKMPLWVLVELISFSNLSKYYNSLYTWDQKIIANLVGFNNNNLSNWLHCMSVLRNMCAHNNRLYNKTFRPATKLTKGFLRFNPDIKNDSLFAYIITLSRLLPNKPLKKDFKVSFINLINSYKEKVNFEKIGLVDNYIKLL